MYSHGIIHVIIIIMKWITSTAYVIICTHCISIIMFEMNRCYYCTLHGVSVLSVHSQSTEWGALAGDVIVHFYWECEVHCHGRDAFSS